MITREQYSKIHESYIKEAETMQSQGQYADPTSLSRAFGARNNFSPDYLRRLMRRKGVTGQVMSAKPSSSRVLILNPYSSSFSQNRANTKAYLGAA